MSEAIETAEALPVAAMQSELFDESSLEVREDLVEMVRARSFLPDKRPDSARFSGKITLKRMLNNEELCEQVCMCIHVGLSVRLIAKRFQMSPHSVVRIRQAMEERGELESVSKRIRQQLDRFIELGMERMVEGVLNGEIHPGQLPIPVLAAIDKKGQLEAGVVPGTEITVGDAAESNIRAAWRAIQLAKEAAASDHEAVASDTQVVDVTSTLPADGAADTRLDTAAKACNPVPTAAEPVPASPAPPPGARSVAPSAAREEGGGGVAISPPPHLTRGDGPENFTP